MADCWPHALFGSRSNSWPGTLPLPRASTLLLGMYVFGAPCPNTLFVFSRSFCLCAWLVEKRNWQAKIKVQVETDFSDRLVQTHTHTSAHARTHTHTHRVHTHTGARAPGNEKIKVNTFYAHGIVNNNFHFTFEKNSSLVSACIRVVFCRVHQTYKRHWSTNVTVKPAADSESEQNMSHMKRLGDKISLPISVNTDIKPRSNSPSAEWKVVNSVWRRES